MSHIYPDVKLLEKHALIGDGHCVALVQALTDVGPTGGWRAGERVMEVSNIPAGTVIAAFENGKYPNRRKGNRAAFYLYSGPGSQKTGRPAYIVVMDQWKIKGKVAARSIYTKVKSKAQGGIYDDSDNAEMFYVVK